MKNWSKVQEVSKWLESSRGIRFQEEGIGDLVNFMMQKIYAAAGGAIDWISGGFSGGGFHLGEFPGSTKTKISNWNLR